MYNKWGIEERHINWSRVNIYTRPSSNIIYRFRILWSSHHSSVSKRINFPTHLQVIWPSTIRCWLGSRTLVPYKPFHSCTQNFLEYYLQDLVRGSIFCFGKYLTRCRNMACGSTDDGIDFPFISLRDKQYLIKKQGHPHNHNKHPPSTLEGIVVRRFSACLQFVWENCNRWS